MKIQSTYEHFSPREYLNEYYSGIGKENQEILNFHYKAYKTIFSSVKNAQMLEFGLGPTIYQLIAPSVYNVKIDVCEYLKGNIDEVNRWVQKERGKFDWENFIKYALQLEGKNPSGYAVGKRSDEIRSKIAKVMYCDARMEYPLGIAKHKPYDILGLHFVAESITSDNKEWEQLLDNITSLLKEDGYFITCAIAGASYYKVNGHYFSAVPVSHKKIMNHLKAHGYSIILDSFVKAEHKAQGYRGISMILAKKTI